MPDTSTTIKVQTIDHVTLVVKDLEQSRQFYVDLLGMEEQDRPNFSFAGSWFQAGPTQIHLILEHDDSGPAGNSDKRTDTQSRTHHFAFVVEDAVAAEKVLREAGADLVGPVKSRPDGAAQVFVRDPDGYVVELTSI